MKERSYIIKNYMPGEARHIGVALGLLRFYAIEMMMRFLLSPPVTYLSGYVILVVVVSESLV